MSITQKFTSPSSAVSDLNSNISIGIGGFGTAGSPFALLAAVREIDITNIELIANNGGLYDWALGGFLQEGRVRRVVATHIGGNKPLEKAFREGRIEVELVPQGTLAERLRAGGAGIGGFLTPTGADTMVELGKMPWKYDENGTIISESKKKRSFTIDGVHYILETALKPNVALVHAWRGDELGNLIFRESARNFNPLFAMASELTIAEVEELVPAGELDPNDIHTPSIFVDRIVEVSNSHLVMPEIPSHIKYGSFHQLSSADEIKTAIAKRAAAELKKGEYVNLGTGIPTLVPGYINREMNVIIHSENGILGVDGLVSEEENIDVDLIDASKAPCTVRPGAAFFDSALSFAMVRGRHLDVSILGAMEVSQHGDIANWMIPGQAVAGMGGAMDLVLGAKRIIVTMMHCKPNGESKIVEDCTLPLTGKRAVSTIVTDLAVIDIEPEGLVLREVAQGSSVDEVVRLTGAPIRVPDALRSPVKG